MQPHGIRVGVVRVGYWGSKHLRVLRSTTGVATVVGVDKRFARIDDGQPRVDHGVAVYADHEDALPHVDAVIIATPPASHTQLGIKAMAAGKHVLIEKPIADRAAFWARGNGAVIEEDCALGNDVSAWQQRHRLQLPYWGSRKKFTGIAM